MGAGVEGDDCAVMEIPIRRLLSVAIIVLALLPQWGVMEYASASNLPPSRGSFTGEQAVVQQLLIAPGLVPVGSCLLWLVGAGGWLIWRGRKRDAAPGGAVSSAARVNRGEGPVGGEHSGRWGKGWDVALAGFWVYCGAVWVQVLMSAVTVSSYPAGEVWYRELVGGFWLFPVGLGVAVGVRVLTWPEGKRIRE
jgi:hypothetical protein